MTGFRRQQQGVTATGMLSSRSFPCLAPLQQAHLGCVRCHHTGPDPAGAALTSHLCKRRQALQGQLPRCLVSPLVWRWLPPPPCTPLPCGLQVVNGFNSTVFAYGQTSSGKTHTMKGTAADPGIIPLAVREVFALINACQDREFLLRVSYMEVGVCGGCFCVLCLSVGGGGEDGAARQ